MGNACHPSSVPLPNELEEPTPVEVKVLKQESSCQNDYDFEQMINPTTQKILNLRKPFWQNLEDLKATFSTKKYANGNRYLGQLDPLQRPHGLGKLLKNDGSIVIAYFKEGILNGPFFYANQQGIICQGEADNGAFTCTKGVLQTPKCKYMGGFKANLFDGEGVCITENSKFEGVYENGKQKQGKLSWSEGQHIYLYDGHFDENEKFTGNGRLVQPFGEYEGQFFEGQKHGKGKYIFNSKLVYQGEYNQGQREGKGRLINKDGSLSYEGDFSQGLPHGNGRSFKSGLILREGEFLDGIHKQFL